MLTSTAGLAGHACDTRGIRRQRRGASIDPGQTDQDRVGNRGVPVLLACMHAWPLKGIPGL